MGDLVKQVRWDKFSTQIYMVNFESGRIRRS